MAEQRSNYSALAQLLNAIITRRDMNVIEQFGMSEDNIHDPYFKEIYVQIKAHNEKYGEVPTPETMLSMGGQCLDYISNMYQPEHEASDEFIRDKVWEDHIYHEAARLLQTSADLVNSNPQDGIEYLRAAIGNIISELGTVGTDIVHDPSNRLAIYKDKQGNSSWFYPTGFPQLDEKIGGFAPGEDLIVLFARTGVGKEQPLYSKVLTPHGWKAMGDLKLGETVITATGEVAPIIGIFPQGSKDVYRLTFTDGSYVDAGIEHLWKVKDRYKPDGDLEIVCTENILKSPHRYKIPCAPTVEFDYKFNLECPYELGCVIGCYDNFKTNVDGSFIVNLTPKNTWAYRCLQCLNLNEDSNSKVVISTNTPLHRDFQKFQRYLRNIVNVDCGSRLELLRGICDSSGIYNTLFNRVEIAFEGRMVGDIACQLIRSMSGNVIRKGKHSGKILAYMKENPFRYIINRRKWKPCKNRRLFRSIQKVEKLESKYPCQCIMVDHPDHTYITDNYTVTHNTWIMTKMLHESWKNGYNVGLIEPEMTGIKIGYRFDTINRGYSNRDLVYGRDLSAGPNDYEKYITELPNQTDTKFMVAHPKDFNGVVTVSKLKNWCIRNEIKILGIDGISYMKDERGKSSDSTTMMLTNISADLMELSIELGIPVIIVVQSNREGTAQGGKLALENIRDSDGISHSASKVFGLYQKNNALHIQLLKNRDGDSDTTLAYDWDINVGKFQYLQEGEVEGDNPEGDNNSTHSYTPQNSNNSSGDRRPERMSSTQSYQNVVLQPQSPTALF